MRTGGEMNDVQGLTVILLSGGVGSRMCALLDSCPSLKLLCCNSNSFAKQLIMMWVVPGSQTCLTEAGEIYLLFISFEDVPHRRYCPVNLMKSPE